MTYRQRLSLFLLVDSLIVLFAIFFSRFLVDATIFVITAPIILTSLTILVSHHLISLRFNLYKKAWEYASTGELLIIFKIVSASILVAIFFQKIVFQEIHFRLLAVSWTLQILLIGGSRFFWKNLSRFYYERN